ncbi:MAG: Lsr2 family protein [Nocardiopsaceae bacterium]|nr:Lsr2 family protein [Nocardiopsaceae bacterium]
MVKKVEVLLIDDIDGGEADETVQFSLDGTDYEIDLSADNTKNLREVLAPYTEAARKVKRTPRNARVQKKAGDRERSRRIRAWAKSQGKPVNERGRIPADIIAEYDAAHR